jgi:hypothetical protein
MNFFRIVVALLVPAVFLAGHAVARDDGRYANLRSSHGSIASKAGGGHAVPPPTARSSPMSIGSRRAAITAYDSGANGSTSPDDAVITEPNRAGRTMVWPMWVRCFLPGSMT